MKTKIKVVRTLRNIDNKVVFYSASDSKFIKFINKIAFENEDDDVQIDTVERANTYLSSLSELELSLDKKVN